MATAYGSSAGTGISSFRVKCDWSRVDLNNGYCRYTYTLSCEVFAGDFYGTNLSLSWGGNAYIYGIGTYGAATYTKDVPYGGNFSVWATCQYTASRKYQSILNSTLDYAPRPTWKVTYNANGGTGAPGAQTKVYGQTLRLSSTKPSRTGYTFLGWSASKTAASASYSPGANYTSNASLTLYAVWKINTWTVKYDANGGTGAPGAQTKTYGQTLILSTVEPTKENYNFLGWGTSEASTSISYVAGDSYTANENITLYAIWELAYWDPKITNVFVDRCNSSGTLVDDGNYFKISFFWELCQLAGDNLKIDVQVSYHPKNATQILLHGNTYNGRSGFASEIVGRGEILTEREYYILLSVSDEKGGNAKYKVTLPPMSYTIDFLKGGTGVSMGRPATLKDTFEVDFNAKFDKKITDRFGTTVENGLAISNNADPNTTLEHVIVTNKNTPISGKSMYVMTYFYDGKTTGSARMQIAYPYSENSSQYFRYYHSGIWSPWMCNSSIEAITVQRKDGDVDVSTAGRIFLPKVISDTSNGKLTSNGIGVVIGEGVKKVLVSMNVFAYAASGQYLWYGAGIIKAGASETSYTRFADCIGYFTASYGSVVISDRILDVSQGDTIVMLKAESNNNKIRGQHTWMTVKVAQ